MSFVNTFSDHFVLATHDVTEKARQYTRGLMQAGSRKNMDRMAEVVPDATSRNLQQFSTHSTWDDRTVIDHVAHDVNNLIGDSRSTGLIIDESCFAKQGKMSVGTSRQWLGRLGKTDNGQVAVFGALANNRFVSPVDVRLYLPKEWTRDKKRCDKAGIPKNERKSHTKIELAIKIVEQARKNRLNYGWVGADAGYGKGPGFCIALAQMSEAFVVDVHSDFFVYTKDPNPYIPEQKTKIGGQFKKYRSDHSPEGVGEMATSIPESEWSVLDLRDTTRGKLKVSAWHHHIALVMMAMVFMLSEKIKHEDEYPLLSCADIEDLLAHFLPRRDTTQNEVIRQMEERHRQRQNSIDSYTRRQRLREMARAQ